MSRLVDVLSTANIVVDSTGVPPGPNSSTSTTVGFEDWVPWRGFDYRTLIEIFRQDLGNPYRGSPQQRPLAKDLCVVNEQTVEDVLRRFDVPIVNYCLERMAGEPHFGRGSRCGGSEHLPDWSLVSDSCLDKNRRLANVLPGETKPNHKWWPAMKDNPRYRLEWQKVISQATTYMMVNGSRYGFLVTDTCLVPLRLTRAVPGPGLAKNRPRRKTKVPVQYASESEGGSGSDYHDDDPLGWTYKDPEYTIIPWDAQGNKLTVKLTLWFLAMMATNGDRYLDYSYPDLNSWRRDGKGYVHNTSGARKSELTKDDKEQEPDPEKKEREAQNAKQAGGAQQHPQQPQNQQRQHPQLPLRQRPQDVQPARGAAGGNGGPSGGHDLRSRRVEAAPAAPAGGGQVDRRGGDPTSSKQAERRGEDPAGGRPPEKGRAEPVGRGSSGERVAAAVGKPQKQTKTVKIEKHTFGSRLHFLDDKGEKTETSQKEWTRVEGGWKLEGKKCIYFTTKFP